jgi:hypothetical protein
MYAGETRTATGRVLMIELVDKLKKEQDVQK